jgi:hypothetical protein
LRAIELKTGIHLSELSTSLPYRNTGLHFTPSPLVLRKLRDLRKL